jgi:MFS family permease
VAAFAVTQTVGYGALYYAFSVILLPISRSLHASTTAVTGAMTVAVVTSGVAGVAVGRWVDTKGGRAVMTVGSAVGTAALLAWAHVHTVAGLYAVFLFIGIASAMALYEPAFAVVVQQTAPDVRARSIVTITIVAGFASSIAFPFTGALIEHFGWRSAVTVLGLVYLVTTLPLHALIVPAGGPTQATMPAEQTGRAATTGTNPPARVLMDNEFWLLLTAFLGQGVATAAIGVHLVSYLVQLGHPPAIAATIAGLLGVLSVTGRLLTTALIRRFHLATVTATVFGIQAIGLILLPLVGSHRLAAVACVALFGIGFGLATIAKPALLADRYGAVRYAGIAGMISMPINISKAAAPVGVAAIAATAIGYNGVMVILAGSCLIAAGILGVVASKQPSA